LAAQRATPIVAALSGAEGWQRVQSGRRCGVSARDHSLVIQLISITEFLAAEKRHFSETVEILVSQANSEVRINQMPNRRLTAEELAKAKVVLASICAQLHSLSAGDSELLFAYRRKVYKELTDDG